MYRYQTWLSARRQRDVIFGTLQKRPAGEEGVSVAGLIHVVVTPVWRCIRAKITIPKISCTPKNSKILNKCLGRIHIWHFNTQINIKEIALKKIKPFILFFLLLRVFASDFYFMTIKHILPQNFG